MIIKSAKKAGASRLLIMPDHNQAEQEGANNIYPGISGQQEIYLLCLCRSLPAQQTDVQGCLKISRVIRICAAGCVELPDKQPCKRSHDIMQPRIY